jgi:hypothetical protein
MLEPDSVCPEIMPAVTNALAGRPGEIGEAHDDEYRKDQKDRAPWGTLDKFPYLHFFGVNGSRKKFFF